MTTVLFSLAPALHATRVDVAGRLAQGGRRMIAGRMGLQRVLVASQVALAVVLLTGAGLVVRSFDRLQRVSPGFSAANVLAFRISAQWSERPDGCRGAAVPDARAAAGHSRVTGRGVQLRPAGRRDLHTGRDLDRRAAERRSGFAERRTVSADYFRVLEVPVLQGAACRDDPRRLQSSQMLVNRTFARTLLRRRRARSAARRHQRHRPARRGRQRSSASSATSASAAWPRRPGR